MAVKESGFLNYFRLTSLVRFFRLLSVERKDILYIYVYALFNGIINLSLPLGIQAIINLISGGQITTSWIILVVIVILGTLFAGIMQIMQVYINERVQQRLFTRAAFEFAYRIPRFKIEALKDHYAPELANRFFDTLTVQKGLSKILIDFSTASLQIVFGLLLLSFYSPYFVIFSFVFVLLAFLIFRITGPAGMRASLEESSRKYQVAYWLEELGRTMPSFKLAGIPNFSMNRTNDLVSAWLGSRKKHFRILLIQFASMVGLKTLVTAGVLVLGGILVMEQILNIGQFVAAEIIIIILLNAVEKLIRSFETIYDVLTATEKISEVTEMELEEEGGMQVKDNADEKGLSIRTEKLSYLSPATGQAILRNINLDISSGESICISGFNGSGKSSLLNALSGLYEKYDGQILFNEIPRNSVDINDLRGGIGDNFSHEDVFHGTVTENITMGRTDVSDRDILDSVSFAGLTTFINRLPQGYSTMIGPEGFNLPRSIIKRIILARSMVRSPLLMAIEDDLSQFEPSEKQRIIAYLTDRSNPWTLLIISNDKGVLNRCDRGIVLKEGELIANDTPDNIAQERWFDDVFA